MTYRYFFLDSGGSSQHFFLTFLSIDEEVTSCSSRNEGKGPPSPSLPGGSWRGTKSRPPPSPFRDRGATKSLQKRRRRPQTHPELENKKKKKNFLNRNASTKQPFHIDRRRMNFVNKLLAFLLILISFSLLRVLFSFYSRPGPFLDRLLKHLLIPHVLSEPPTHSITCL